MPRWTRITRFVFALTITASVLFAYSIVAYAAPDLTVTPLTWNVIGLDSNRPADGPRHFPVAARVCSPTGTGEFPVVVDFIWDDTDGTYIYLRPGSLSQLTFADGLGVNECVDAYFEVEVNPIASSFDRTRAYHITATSGPDIVATPQPRELYVEHLVSQNRNATTTMRYGTSLGDLTSVAPGGNLNLLVGETYYIQLEGGTATQGYEQIEQFLTLTNTIFQINGVTTDYAVNTSPNVSDPSDLLYADACLWDNDPASPNYLSCQESALKTGGAPVTVTYNVTILSGGGTTVALNSLLYDFSGSSFHYNSDFSSGVRFGNIIDPSNAGISKRFVPSTTNEGGTSTLVFTLTNPNAGTLSGYNFDDTLPTGVVIASSPSASTSGCGTPTLIANATESTISFDNGTVPGNGSCTISVNVTAATAGSYVNVSDNLFIGIIDTGNSATATLEVITGPPPPTCTGGLPLANWDFDLGVNNPLNPAPNAATVTVNASPGSGLTPIIDSATNTSGTSGSWESDQIDATGSLNLTLNQYFEFAIDTTGLNEVDLQFYAERSQQGAQNVRLYYGATGTEIASDIFSIGTSFPASPYTTNINTGLVDGTTIFRLYVYNAGNNNPGHSINIDGVSFTGCGVPNPPTLAKSYSPDPIAAGAISTLTFTLSNPNATIPLTGVTFSDGLPNGMTVASTPGAISNCGGNWAYTGGESTLNFTGGTIPANSSCTLLVNVTSATPGPSTNISGFISSTESGINDGPDGSATATLTVLSPPRIDKQFSPNPIVAGNVSSLTFTISNPNQNDTLNAVAFSDTFPGGMIVATPANATASASCGGTWTPAGGAGVVSFSGGTIAGGSTCTLIVDVFVAAAGSYANTSSNVSYQVNGQTINGNTASDTLVANTPILNVDLLKQIGLSATGPWTSYLAVEAGDLIYYLITIENTGEGPLSPVIVTDANVDLSGCTWTNPLPVANATSEAHIDTCVVGPVSALSAGGEHPNTAQINAGGQTASDTAIYATALLELTKEASPTTYTAENEIINYTFTVTNPTISAVLSGPVTIADSLIPGVSCPALATVGDGDNFFDPGESVVCTATYTTTADDVTAGSINNTATASAGGVTSPEASVIITTPVTTGITVVKTAAPESIPEPGGNVTFTLEVTNTGSVDAALTSLVDNIHGDLNGQGDCAVPQTIASGDIYSCSFTAVVTGNAGYIETDTITAIGTSNGSPVSDNDDATVTITDVPSAIEILKTASPDRVDEPGGDVTFTFAVNNLSAVDSVTINSLSDSIYGDLNGQGDCTVPQAIAASGNYTCSITAFVTGNAGDTETNVVTASGLDDDGNPVSDNDDETVTVTDVPAAIEILKTASPDNVDEPGGDVTFSFVVNNLSAVDSVTINSLNDSIYGDLNGQGDCTVPQAIAAGGSYSCSFTAFVAGNAGDTETNVVTASGLDDDGNPVSDDNDATVTITDVPAVELIVEKATEYESLPELGGTFNYTATITNPSTVDTATITAIPDTYGAPVCSDDVGVIALPNDLGPGESLSCAFSVEHTGNAGENWTNVVSVVATNDDGADVSADSNEVMVYLTDVPSAIEILKTASPDNVDEPGGDVTFSFVVNNLSAVDSVTINSLSDSIYGDLNGQGDCSVPQTIAASGNYTCSFTAFVTGNAGDTETNVVTASGLDDDGNPVSDNDDETVTVTDVPSAIEILKTASPDSVDEPGGDVTFSFVVNNLSAVDSVTIDSLTDTIYGDLNGQGDCAVPQTIAASGNYTCSFTAFVAGNAGDTETNVVTASGTDNDGNPVSDNDNETVTVTDVPSAIEILKTASPDSVDEQGGDVTFSFVVNNLSAVDSVTIDSLTDTIYGDLNGQGDCAVPQTIAAGGNYACSFTAFVAGNAGDTETNVVTASGTDDDGNPVSDDDDATVTITDVPSVIEATKTAAFQVDSDNDGLVDPGDTLLYTVILTNTGTADATSVVFVDTPDTNTTLIAGSVITSQGTVTTGNTTGDTSLSVDVGTLAAPTGSVTITFQVTVNDPFPTSVTQVSNQGTVSGDNFTDEPTDDPDTPTDDDPTVTPISTAPVIEATKTAALQVDSDNDGLVDPGDTLRYTVTITNTGAADGLTVFYADTPDANTTLVVGSVAATQGSVTTGNTAGDINILVDIGTLIAPGGNVTITYDATVNDPLPDDITELENQGIVSGDNFEDVPTNDPSTADPDDPTIIPIGTPPPPPPSPSPEPEITYFDPAISKVGELGPGQLGLPGESLTWIVTITNVGTGPGTNVTITDVIQSELQITNISVDTGTASTSGQTISFFIPVLNPGEVVTGYIYTTVLRSPFNGEFANTATLSGTGPNGETVTAATTATISAPYELPDTGYPRTGAQRFTPIMLYLLAGFGVAFGWLLHRRRRLWR